MNIVTRERSCSENIKWEGFPSTTPILEYGRLKKEHSDIGEAVEKKRERLMELIQRQIMRRNLRQRNNTKTTSSVGSSSLQEGGVKPTSIHEASSSDVQFPLPFVVLTTSQKAHLNITLDEERTDVRINMNGHDFLLTDDEMVLSSLEM